MKVRFETFIVIAAAFMAFAFVAFDGYFRLKEARIIDRLNYHGFGRTAVITTSGLQPDDPDFDAAEFIGASKNSRRDASAVMSRRSLSELAALPVVANVLAVTKSTRKLTLPSGLATDVNCYNVPPDFGAVFRLSAADAITPGIYVPSAALRKAAGLATGIVYGSLGVADEVMGVLPPATRARIDWSKATLRVTLSDAALALPADSPMFDLALFTTGREAKLEVPGLFLIPTVNIFVKLRDDVPVETGMAALSSFLARATPSVPGASLALTPLLQFFADELGIDQYRAWSEHIRQGIGSGGVLLFSALVLVRQKRIRHEIALRRAVGVPAAWAAWLSTRAMVLGLACGVPGGAILGAALVCLVTAAGLPALTPSLAGIGGAIATAVLVLVSGAGLFSRVDLASQLKRL
jgi:hypothetical protein